LFRYIFLHFTEAVMSAFYQMFPCRLHRVNILMIMLLFCTWGQDVNAKFMTHLSNGLEFPLIGLGTGGQLKENTIKSALQIGYKLIDSGQVDAWYLEDEVARAIKKEDHEALFITTKIHPRDFSKAKEMIWKSHATFGINRIDAVLIHAPRCWDQNICPKNWNGDWRKIWPILEWFYEQKCGQERCVRAIGVSNFRIQEMKELLEIAKIKPHLVQNYNDPFHQDREVLNFCKEHDIQYQAFSSLGAQWPRQIGYNPVFQNEELKKIATELNRSVAQVVLRWQLSLGIAVIPRSRKENRLQENFDLNFDLSDAHINSINNLDGKVNQASANEQLTLVFNNRAKEDITIKYKGTVQAQLPGGESVRIRSYNGHRFTINVGDSAIGVIEAKASRGRIQQHHISQRDVDAIINKSEL